MVKNLSNFFKKDTAGPVVVMTQAGSDTEAETVAETPAAEAPAAEAPAETTTTEPVEPAASADVQTPAAQVSISPERLGQLEGFERDLTAMRPKYEILEAWYNNVKGEGASVGKDASEEAGKPTSKSWETAPWNQK